MSSLDYLRGTKDIDDDKERDIDIKKRLENAPKDIEKKM